VMPVGEPVCGLREGVPESTSSIDQSRLSSMSSSSWKSSECCGELFVGVGGVSIQRPGVRLHVTSGLLECSRRLP
jgi:hypothetical protein